MLLTLSASCIRPLLAPGKTGKARLALSDLADYTRQTLGLHGLNLPTDLLAGLSRPQIERVRERADKAGAACLVLIEHDPLSFGDESDNAAASAQERLRRVIQAGQLLGCNAVAVRAAGRDDPAVLQRTAERMRRVVQGAEKLELNVLIWPSEGLTATPERVTELIKKIGGFRVGTLPDFQSAAASAEPVAYLRRLTPYASLVSATTLKFVAQKGDGEPDPDQPVKHASYELKPMVDAILSVGYDGTLAVDYRGSGDATLGVVRSRKAFEALLGLEKPAEA